MPQKIRVAQIGLGPIGVKVTRYLLLRKVFELCGAFDSDPAKAGLDAGELADGPPSGLNVTDDLSRLADCGAQVAVLTTASSLAACEDSIIKAVEAGLHVVSTCEELAYPWLTQPALSSRLDAAAKARGVAILGAGVNPGFMMDFLPAAVSGVCLDVRGVRAERVQDASRRRLPFQNKIGAGLPLEEFHRRVREKTLRHVGFTESMHMIAARLGWTLDRVEDVVEPVLTQAAITAGDTTVEAGRAIGVRQMGRGWRDGRELSTLAFRATIGEAESYDRIRIEGVPDIEVKIPGGVNGDIATCAITVNAIPTVINAAPGLRTMADIAPVTCFNASGSGHPE